MIVWGSRYRELTMQDTIVHTRYVAGEVWDIGGGGGTLGETFGKKTTLQPVRVATCNPFGGHHLQKGFNPAHDVFVYILINKRNHSRTSGISTAIRVEMVDLTRPSRRNPACQVDCSAGGVAIFRLVSIHRTITK
jgi:hypothetical protein